MMAALIKDPVFLLAYLAGVVVGPLLAVLGNVIGTYAGRLVAQVRSGLTA